MPLVIILGIIIAVLIFLLTRKQTIDKTQLDKYHEEIAEQRTQLEKIKTECNVYTQKIDQAYKKYHTIIEQYQNATQATQQQIDQYFEGQRQRQRQRLEQEINQRKKVLEQGLQLDLENKKQEYNSLMQGVTAAMEYAQQQKQKILANVEEQRQKLEGILEPLRLYQKEEQAKLFYTIQIPQQFRDDINFLLTVVSQKVRHPDVISKLVWTEYVRPAIEATFKRIEIKSQPGIYKLTNLTNNKPYIGKSTDVKKRIADHFKSSVGIKSIADQAVHHAILEEGIWNWTIEIVTYCDKDKLSQLEKYYIDFFKTQDYGYNLKGGG